jgi:hypothetical protein
MSDLDKIYRDIVASDRIKAVDEWHPASKPPMPEDFEPTGPSRAFRSRCQLHRKRESQRDVNG